MRDADKDGKAGFAELADDLVSNDDACRAHSLDDGSHVLIVARG
jgi:hypothetical protein